MIAIEANGQNITEPSRGLQVSHVAHVQQVKASVRGYNLFSNSPQSCAVIGKLFNLHDFWIHTFVPKFDLCGNSQLV
jgi:hypothetical protein